MGSLFNPYFLADAAVTGSNVAATSLPIVISVGFVAAVAIGSITWYNSKRPPGWEGKERPDIVPEIQADETPGLGAPER
jgi:hypothetical protein